MKSEGEREGIGCGDGTAAEDEVKLKGDPPPLRCSVSPDC